LVPVEIGVVAGVDVVVRQRAAHVHVDVLSEARALFDGACRGEILILVLALGLLVELELARAATHFLSSVRDRLSTLSFFIRVAAYPLKINSGIKETPLKLRSMARQGAEISTRLCLRVFEEAQLRARAAQRRLLEEVVDHLSF